MHWDPQISARRNSENALGFSDLAGALKYMIPPRSQICPGLSDTPSSPLSDLYHPSTPSTMPPPNLRMAWALRKHIPPNLKMICFLIFVAGRNICPAVKPLYRPKIQTKYGVRAGENYLGLSSHLAMCPPSNGVFERPQFAARAARETKHFPSASQFAASRARITFELFHWDSCFAKLQQPKKWLPLS